MQPLIQKSRILLQIDPWMPEYEGSVEIDPAEGSASGVDATVEGSDWKAITVTSVHFIISPRGRHVTGLKAWTLA
jgi:hypothetical protein